MGMPLGTGPEVRAVLFILECAMRAAPDHMDRQSARPGQGSRRGDAGVATSVSQLVVMFDEIALVFSDSQQVPHAQADYR